MLFYHVVRGKFETLILLLAQLADQMFDAEILQVIGTIFSECNKLPAEMSDDSLVRLRGDS